MVSLFETDPKKSLFVQKRLELNTPKAEYYQTV